MENFNGRHFLLYAKGYYARTEKSLWEDMRRIVGATCVIPYHLVSEDDIYRVCLNVVTDYCKQYQPFSAVDILNRLLIDIGKDHISEGVNYTKGRSPRLAIIEECLSFLSGVQVLDGDKLIISMGDPDPNVLPLSIKSTDFQVESGCTDS